MKALRSKPKYKVYFRYQNIHLWKKLNLVKLHHKKWNSLKVIEQSTMTNKYVRGIKPIYLCHSKKLNVERLYFYKFLNKQILRHYLVNYTESSFSKSLKKSYINFECRLDYNLYKTNFVTSLYEARFFITHGYIFVNNKQVKNVNYNLSTNDLVMINPKIWVKIKNNLFQKLTYNRNLEIDYKSGSFIFFNLKKFFILNFDNFIKEIYLTKNKNFKLQNKLKITRAVSFTNNYFIFFDSIFNYYLFLNNITHVLNKRKHFTSNIYTCNYLIKYLRIYFNDYFFRNILLKRIFQYKFEYLSTLPKNIVLNSNFTNNISCLDHANILNKDFFKYYYNLILKFYILMIKNFYINQLNFTFTQRSLNIYKTNVFIISDIFKFLNIKNKLFNFYKTLSKNSNIGYTNKTGINKYKLIDTSVIKHKKTNHTRYLQHTQFNLLVYYISSNIFKYKLYTKCRSFYQNNKRRYNALKKIRRAFLFKYYNKLHFGSTSLNLTKNQLYNYSMHLTKVENSKVLISKVTKHPTIYYPITTKLYSLIYTSSILNKTGLLTELKTLIKNIEQFTVKSTNQQIVNDLIFIKNQLINKLQFFETSKVFTNFNCNIFYKNIYLLINLVKNITKGFTNYNLQHNQYNTLYKVHLCNNYLNSKFAERYSTKRTHHFLSYYSQRIKLNYFYLNLSKSRKFLPVNTITYFSKPSQCKTFNFLINFYHYRKGRSKYFYQYNFNCFKLHNISTLNKDSLCYYKFNMNIIDTNYKFNDILFLIDLILNISTRSLNTCYNFINIKSSKKNIITQVQYKLNITKDNSNINYNIKKLKNLTKKYYTFNNYSLHFYNSKICRAKIFFNYTIKTYKNRILYFYNFNNYNQILFDKLYKLYFINYNFNKNFRTKRIYSNFNKQNQISNIYKIYTYYMYNIRKYHLIKYIFNNYIFKEYDVFVNNLLTNKNIKQTDNLYVKQLYYNLLFTKFYNFNYFDSSLKNNYIYSHNFRIMINYFILIKRFYH